MRRPTTLTLISWLALSAMIVAAPRDAEWKKVTDAMNQGLPQTAIKELEPIIKAAVAEQRWAEAIKAIGRKTALEGTIQGNKPEEKITRFEAELAKAADPMKPAMQSILANWYWQYFQQNRWRFMQRTQTAAAPGADFTTWDLPRILAEVDKQFARSLAQADQLKQIKVADYDELLEKGTLSDAYRPTLYDFLAYQALAFYTTGEHAANKAIDDFELSAAGPIFAPAAEFIAWKPDSTDDTSLSLRAVKLFQDLLKFHADDADPTALIDADLARLMFGKNLAVGDEKIARYKAALRRIADERTTHELSSRALALWAQQEYEDGDWVKARELAQQGKTRFPSSVGGKECHNLIDTIEAPNGTIVIERVWNAPLPTIDVDYRNLRKVYFRAVEFDYDAWLRTNLYTPLQMDDNQRKSLLAKKPVLEWNADLPATDDYQSRTEQVAIPPGLKAGSYYLIAAFEPTFADTKQTIQFADFWVSDLALVMKTGLATTLEGFTLNAITGEPLAGAEVKLYVRNNQGGLQDRGKTTSDANGKFSLQTGQQHSQNIIDARHTIGRLATAEPIWIYQHHTPPALATHTMFFTDRAIYRPGQTIHYKGICLSSDTSKGDYQTLGATEVNVVFNDPNGKEVERRTHRTNDYGSFSGSFTAPRDRLMGAMNLVVQGGPHGQTSISVEEYKRPKFQTALEAPSEGVKLDGEVKVAGKATAYTGAAIDGAKVSWRVVREVRYPTWWWARCWWMPPSQGEAQEIAHGSSTTDTAGAFSVTFTAKPDRAVDPESQPTFQFTVHADVTDSAGETRSASKVVSIGYTALAAEMQIESWQVVDKPSKVRVQTTTLDGEPVATGGQLKIVALVQPDKVHRAPLAQRYGRGNYKRTKKAAADLSNIDTWPTGEVVFDQAIKTDASGWGQGDAQLKVGAYLAKFETQDRFGKTVTTEKTFKVLDPAAEKLALRVPNLVQSQKHRLEPGEEYLALWGSGYDTSRAFVEVESHGKLLQAYWTPSGRTQATIKQATSEALRGGFFVRVTQVRENRGYTFSERVDVPWTNKELTLKWEHFVSKLEPNQRETWTAVVTGHDAKQAVAEMVATLYDASLEQFQHLYWPTQFGNYFYQDYSSVQSRFENSQQQLHWLRGQWRSRHVDASYRYRQFPNDITAWLGGFEFQRNRNGMMFDGQMRGAGAAMPAYAPAAAAPAPASEALAVEMRAAKSQTALGLGDARKDLSMTARDANTPFAGGANPAGEGPDLSKVTARKNLQETAFFFPHLIANDNGEVRLEFQMPEALTEWKFLGFAHDRQLRGGLLMDSVVTSKEIMVQPNPPRFLREGDSLEFSVKVTNRSAARQQGNVQLTLADARTGDNVDTRLGNANNTLPFDVPAGESRSYHWRLAVPDDTGFLTYKVVGSTGRLADGEEGYLPVLSRRVLVTESLPLPIRGKQTKDFTFKHLADSAKSDTLKHQSLTVQMVSNPSWYAVMSLPYLMEYPYECTEQSFNRLYANALARHIAASDPKIRRVFDQWRGTDALDSPLTKNQDLKSVMLEETPWLRQAMAEGQARRNVGVLFDDNRLNVEIARLVQKLTEAQMDDGAWPWFAGGRPNDYITLYITTGFARLRHLGAKIEMAPAIKAVDRLDAWAEREYREIVRRGHQNLNNLTSTVALYLYCRSFFLADKPIAPPHVEMNKYWLAQAKQHWLDLGIRQSQGHLALALKRFNDVETAQAIMRSLAERAVHDEELGMFWRELELSWWWYRAPIETQALMIEAFDEVANDPKAVEDCKVWLLKQKQTQDWKTTKATADAIYALLLRGANQLASDTLVEVTLGGATIEPEKTEAGTGFFEQRFVRTEIKPEQAKITLKKTDDGVAWGSVHWQYLEDMSKVQPYDGTPLKLKKSLFTKQPSRKGPTLEAVDGPLAVGDELVVRVELRVDRDMEYVHLKDYRGSGTEPVSVLSGYRFQDGLAYYQSTRDTASHFFIDYLPKGVYVFEYSTRVQHKGRYQTGIAEIQSMYAPEFNSHSESMWIEVK